MFRVFFLPLVIVSLYVGLLIIRIVVERLRKEAGHRHRHH